MSYFNPPIPQFIGGVYQIRNVATNERYIGASRNLRARRSGHQHRLIYGYHTGLLQTAFDRYGPEVFAFEVIIICEPEWLDKYEWALIERWQPVYNYWK